jgi:tetratricopeptide (TPR) repeat protein
MVFLKKVFIFILLNVSLAATPAQAQDPLVKAFSESYTAEKAKDYKKAIEPLKKVYAEDSYEINLRLGWLYFYAGQLNESVQYYKKAVALKPYAIEPKLGLAQPLGAQGKIDELLSLYQGILVIDPQNSVVNYRVGLIYYNKSQFEKALPYLEKVVNLYPFDYDGVILLAWNQFKLQKVKEARVLFNKALLYNPGDASATEGLKLLK